MPWAWGGAAAAAAVYLARVALGRKGPLKVVPASLLAVAMWPSSPLAALALAFCALGDALLLDKDRFFLHGLGAFLVAHVLLVPALLSRAAGAPSAGPLAGIALAFVLVLAGVLPRVRGRLRLAIPLYAAALAAMLAAAAAVSPLSLLAAAIFALSDTLLAVNRFVRPLPAADLAVSLTYQSALLLLTGALLRLPPP